jgi:hypothetical protein
MLPGCYALDPARRQGAQPEDRAAAAPNMGTAPDAHARAGSAFNFWHPRLITLHLWLWYLNPSGLYMGTNPLAAPFNRG